MIIGKRIKIRVDEVKNYKKWQHRRTSIKPGITGLWQVSGRNNIKNFSDIVRLDLLYIDGWSLRWEIKIIIQTIFQIFKGEGM